MPDNKFPNPDPIPSVPMEMCHFPDATQKTDIASLAAALGRSPMQLHRDFLNRYGYTVNEYLRRRRLSGALALIRTTALSLSDIAYACGYSSQQAMSRDIRAILGMTATEYRQGDAYYYLAAPDAHLPFVTSVGAVHLPDTVCLRYDAKSPTGLETAAVTQFLSQNPNFMGRIIGRNASDGENGYGFGAQKRFSYLLYVQETETIRTDGFTVCGKQAGYQANCAQIRVKYEERKISAAWDYLYAKWLPGSMFAYAGADDASFESGYFEEYIYKNGEIRRLHLCLPVVRQDAALRITLVTETMYILAAQKMETCAADTSSGTAEADASREIVRALAKHRPGLLRGAHRFYCRRRAHDVTCGVVLPREVNLSGDDGWGDPGCTRTAISFEAQPFAVLHFSSIHDTVSAGTMLLRWVSENGLSAVGDVFAIYDTASDFDAPSMHVYCPIEQIPVRKS